MIDFHLSVDDEIRAARIGGRRRINAYRLGQSRARHFNGSNWGANIEGACAELAVALALGLEWTGENQFQPPFTLPDVGDDIEVRQVGRGNRLVLRFDERDISDKAERRFVLAEGWAPSFSIHGWARPAEAKRDEWRTIYPERLVWEMPATHLHPLEDISRK
jgi:hypothetical protein